MLEIFLHSFPTNKKLPRYLARSDVGAISRERGQSSTPLLFLARGPQCLPFRLGLFQLPLIIYLLLDIWGLEKPVGTYVPVRLFLVAAPWFLDDSRTWGIGKEAMALICLTGLSRVTRRQDKA
ncbi:hypothetical protein NQ315_000653 [Exocentrus adspersus]|uniref:Uncharacterized protein n=1 Tax=Exocentrus adspersus TaxID=1586481 RepID=A0AAV8VNW0_9CUCU|nr:hypothetical protein NQ315_000653 [Exocentrus adspersus]